MGETGTGVTASGRARRATITIYLEELPGGNATDALLMLPLHTVTQNAREKQLVVTGVTYALDSHEAAPGPEQTP